MVSVPLAVMAAASGSREAARQAHFLTLLGTYSLFPLLFEWREYAVKVGRGCGAAGLGLARPAPGMGWDGMAEAGPGPEPWLACDGRVQDAAAHQGRHHAAAALEPLWALRAPCPRARLMLP
jgi:hypothetical protein